MKNGVLESIRMEVESFVGRTVRLKANRGRKKVMEAEGILEKTYPNVFVVKISDESQGAKRVSFTYTDVLTDAIQVSICGLGDEAKCIGS